MRAACLYLLLFVSGFASAQERAALAQEQAGLAQEQAALAPEQAALAQERAAAEPAAPSPSSDEGAEAGDVPAEPGVKSMSGMSILGNEEAPKALVIVPWKSSRIGDEVGVVNAMDERARPVDKEVFMREVHYYGLRAGSD
jgi:hypothetical protein